MKKIGVALAILALIPFALVTADEEQGPAEKAANTTKKTAEETGQTIKHDAKAAGSAIVKGAKTTERTVGKGLQKAGNTIRNAGATPSHPRHRTTHTSPSAKSSPVNKESPTSEPSSTPEVNPATRPSPSPTPEVNPATTPGTLPARRLRRKNSVTAPGQLRAPLFAQLASTASKAIWFLSPQRQL